MEGSPDGLLFLHGILRRLRTLSLNLTFSSSSPHYCQGRKTEHICIFNSGTPFLLLLGLYLC